MLKSRRTEILTAMVLIARPKGLFSAPEARKI